jgi:hypothetical protein
VPLSIGLAGCSVVALYLVVCFAVVQVGATVTCTADGPSSDPSALVTGEPTWRWIPLTAECVWAVDEQGRKIGPPNDGATTSTRPVGGVVGSWFMTGLALLAIAGLTIALIPTKRRADEHTADAADEGATLSA